MNAIALSRGKTAAIALASRGIGHETASRVIRKMRVDVRSFTGIFLLLRGVTKRF